MKIAIVNQHFHIGGVETFILSLVRELRRLEHEIQVFLLDTENPNALLPDLQALEVTVEHFDALRVGNPAHRFDVVLVTNGGTFFETLRLLERGCFETDRLIAGVYQTKMYCLDRGPFNLHNRLTRKVFSRMPVENAVFGNDACRDEHAKVAPAMANAPIIPLIVDGEKFPRRPAFVPKSPRRIVSIGRLDHFKTYNLTMPEVIRRLRDQGHDVNWEVYGTGMLQAQMERRILELGLGSNVRLLGNIDYRAIPQVLADAFAFVGSGLSMMEAAACGVPALPAIEYCDKPETFGLPQEIEGISFFEPDLPLPRYDLGTKLAELLSTLPHEYEAIGDAAREKMSHFFPANVAQRYIDAFTSASGARPLLGVVNFQIFKASAALHRRGLELLKHWGMRGQ